MIRSQRGKDMFRDEYNFIYGHVLARQPANREFTLLTVRLFLDRKHTHMLLIRQMPLQDWLLIQWCHLLAMDMKVQETLFVMQYRDAAKTHLQLFRADEHCHVVYSALVVG